MTHQNLHDLKTRFKNRVHNSYRMLDFESFVFTCLTYKNVQRFQKRTSPRILWLES